MEESKLEPELTLCAAVTEHSVLTEVTALTAAGEPILVGFIFHVREYYRLFTAAGNLYDVHMDETRALDGMRQYAARLLLRGEGRRVT